MLTRRVRIQAVVFVVIGLLASVFIAIRYVGLLRLVGVGVYTVHLELPTAGGIFPNAEVDYRGVPVGRVGDVSLTPTGVEAQLVLNNSAPSIPKDVEAVVADRSVIGEQYVDLRPRVDHGPYLANGSLIDRANSAVPPSAYSLLTSSNALLRSIPLGSLRTVVGALGKGFGHSPQNVRTLIESGKSLVIAADANFPQTRQLIVTSRKVLATQEASASSIRSFSQSLRLLSGQLASHDDVLRGLLAQIPPAARTAEALIRDVGSPLGLTISNLTSTAEIGLANVRGIQELLVQVPHVVDIGSRVVSPQGANVGLTLTFFDPLPCTQGYEGTAKRSGLSTGPGQPLNTNAGCTSTAGGSDVRGAQHVSSNAGSQPGWLVGTASSPTSSVHSLAGLMGS